MTIKKVDTIEEANICDELLTLLIQDEKKYDDNISDFVVKDWYNKLYNDLDKVIFVAKENDEIIGYIYVKVAFDPSMVYKVTLIDALYVKEEYRFKGIATELINTAKNWTKEQGIKQITINVIEKNDVAYMLYRKLGFDNYSICLKCNI